MSYIKVPTDLHEVLADLSEIEIGRLFTAMLRFAKTGDEPILSGNERFLWNYVKKFCHYIKPKKVYTGEQHWNWKGGITSENVQARHSIEYKQWRAKVFARDGFTCQICGQTGNELNAHHIKPWAKYPNLRFEISNGITLCKSCHKLVHKKGK